MAEERESLRGQIRHVLKGMSHRERGALTFRLRFGDCGPVYAIDGDDAMCSKGMVEVRVQENGNADGS